MTGGKSEITRAVVAQLVEHFHGKEEVTGSIPVNGSMGRYRSGQTGQTVNLLALRLPRFESLPAHHVKSLATSEGFLRAS